MTRICTICLSEPVASRWATYTDEASHVLTDLHLEAMATETVRDWAARPPFDPDAVGLAKQLARLELFYGDYQAWLDDMGLPDNDESFALSKRLGAVWIKAIVVPGYEKRMTYARKLIEAEHDLQKGGPVV